MSTTTTINPSGATNTSGKKNFASQAAATTVAAAAGAVGAAAVKSGIFENEETISDMQEEVAEEQTVQETVANDVITSNQTTQSSQSSATQPQTSAMAEGSVADVVEELEPITNSSVSAEESSDEESYTEVVENIDNQVEELTETQDVPTETQVEEFINPDEIAEAIISEEQVDPNDIDMEDVINFDEIGTVYTVDGESYTAASFHDASGNQMVMVDVDDDDVFDLVTDFNGNIIAEVPGTVTVDDAEIDIVDDGTYLAHNDNEVTDQFGEDTIAQDMIS